MPNQFTLTFFPAKGAIVSCSHSNRDLFTFEDNMLFSHVKISYFRAKAHLAFHWYLYNKREYSSPGRNSIKCDILAYSRFSLSRHQNKNRKPFTE